jgi:hypothetical protein
VGSALSDKIQWIGIFGVVYGYTLLGLSHELTRAYEAATLQERVIPDSRKIA